MSDEFQKEEVKALGEQLEQVLADVLERLEKEEGFEEAAPTLEEAMKLVETIETRGLRLPQNCVDRLRKVYYLCGKEMARHKARLMGEVGSFGAAMKAGKAYGRRRTRDNEEE